MKRSRLSYYRYFSIVLIAIICNLPAKCQAVKVFDTIARHFSYFGLSRPSTTLFVHFDKNVYTNSENAWFTGYLIRTESAMDAYHTMAVALIGNRDKKVWKEVRYVMHQGISSGCLRIPDTIPPGSYTLLAYTNRIFNNEPEDVFRQAITVKTAEDAFNAFIWLDTTSRSKGIVDVQVRSADKENKALLGTDIYFYTGREEVPAFWGHTRTNRFGTAIISVPEDKLTTGSALHVLLKQDLDFKTLTLPLPTDRPPGVVVHFFPEGGSLVSDTRCRVGWEVKKDDGKSMHVKGILCENGVPIETVLTNRWGMGSFQLTAKAGSRYQVEILDSSGSNEFFALPQQSPPAPTISIANAVANDSLVIQVQNLSKIRPLYLAVHNTETIFAAYALGSSRYSNEVVLPLAKIPKGIAILTLIDSLGRPFAERLFFAHYDDTTSLQVTTDRFEFKPKQAVHLTLKLDSHKAQKQEAIVSVACVQNNRIDYSNYTDIESYVYIKRVLESTPFFPGLITSEGEKMAYLEQVLLIKGWRRYRWQDVMSSKASDTAYERSSLAFAGWVESGGHKVHQTFEVSLLSSSTLQLATSDQHGGFSLDDRILTTSPEGKIQLLVNNRNPEAYQIVLEDPYKRMDETLGRTIEMPEGPSLENHSADPAEPIQTGPRGMLKTVIVKTKPNNNLIFYPPVTNIIGRNQCGDYVCINKVLNCPVHKDDFRNKPPVVGRFYYVYGGTNPGGKKYEGCTTEIKQQKGVFLDGIYTNKEFYLPDSIDLASPAPLYLSTLYWNPSVMLSDGKPTTITFYTGDITGRFRIIVQGRTGSDVLSGEAAFVVAENAQKNF